jgi:tRNA threonylcarbamoyl adenosine modification protein YeaZ
LARLTLGFDTSAAHCAAALVLDGRVVASVAEEMAKGQAERLFPLMEELLAGAGAGWCDLGALGVGVGPGNFTGIRIAVASARGLALSLGIPAEGVTGFEALACGLEGPVLAAIDARQGRTYVQALPGGGAMLVADDAPLPFAVAAGARVVGHRAEAIALPLRGTAVAAPHPLAEAIALIAAGRAAPGRARPAPLYLRAPDAAPAKPPPRIVP